MKFLLTALMFLVIGCDRKEIHYEQSTIGVKTDCKGDERQGFYCKYTNSKGKSVCAKSGDSGFNVPCEFYEDL